MGSGIFITGTDTGVGKTAISAALGQAIQERSMTTGVMKPIETGVDKSHAEHSDAFRLRHAVSSQQSLESVSQYQFSAPLAPLSAARKENATIDLMQIQLTYEKVAQDHHWIIIEGIGGVMVPLTKTMDVRDLIKTLKLPCIVIGRTSLGGINHLQLTLEALQNHQIDVIAIVLNNCTIHSQSGIDTQQGESTEDLIREFSNVPVFGPIQYEPELTHQWDKGVNRLKQQEPIRELTDYLLTQMPK